MELLQHGDPPRVPEPHPENRLVRCLRGPEAVAVAARRLTEHGHSPVSTANPYRPEHGAVLFEDPDGWQVVLAPGRAGSGQGGPPGFGPR
ncbi:hypothetical protein AB5J72_03135 [Streptomyces sp. CG1]|uniref:hypothetical protein n=1 Tax=Streptomyces sp. CG1 TaxID=1287523 RepID=UPI0034E2954E